MKESARYAKIVEWSEEDGCYVGSAPGLILGGCHGPDEKEVFAELCEIVEEAVALYRADGNLFPRLRPAAMVSLGIPGTTNNRSKRRATEFRHDRQRLSDQDN